VVRSINLGDYLSLVARRPYLHCYGLLLKAICAFTGFLTSPFIPPDAQRRNATVRCLGQVYLAASQVR
jgi:hypothetical protein